MTDTYILTENTISTNITIYSIFKDTDTDISSIVHWNEFVYLLIYSYAFRETLITALRNIHFPAFFWEFNPVSPASSEHLQVQFAVIHCKALENVEVESSSFKEHIRQAKERGMSTAVFSNFAGDSELIIPVANTGGEFLSHIASFINHAPDEIIHEFLIKVGERIEQKLSNKMEKSPLWLSTSGLGVYYLHMRIDPRPKYYNYEPFKVF